MDRVGFGSVDDRADRDHGTNMIAIEKGKRGSTRHTNLIRSSSRLGRDATKNVWKRNIVNMLDAIYSPTGADPKSLASIRLWKLSYGRKKRNKYPV